MFFFSGQIRGSRGGGALTISSPFCCFSNPNVAAIFFATIVAVVVAS